MIGIAVVTSSRADFGLLTPLLRQINMDPESALRLIVAGTHWSQAHGSTVEEILSEGFDISGKVDCFAPEEDRVGINRSLGRTVIGISEELARLKPEICVVLGDRFEILAATVAATVLGIPVAHIHGGELTFGAIDDCFRHSITKMSYLHFTSTETYRNRVIQLGESPERVFNVGALGVENIRSIPLMERESALELAGIKGWNRFAMLTYHPETLAATDDLKALSSILAVLEENPELNVVATMANADHGGGRINRHLVEYAATRQEHFRLFPSLGSTLYLSLMRQAEFVIGNSSSGILEVPAFGLPSINIGRRQAGRIQAASTLNCTAELESLRASVREALDPEFRARCKTFENPYEGCGTSRSILHHIKAAFRAGIDLQKEFYDIRNGGRP